MLYINIDCDTETVQECSPIRKNSFYLPVEKLQTLDDDLLYEMIVEQTQHMYDDLYFDMDLDYEYYKFEEFSDF